MNIQMLAAVAAIAVTATCAHSAVNVKDFGAKADGSADTSVAIQKALDAAVQNGGGVVDLGVGRFRLDGPITVPAGVTLAGVWEAPHHAQLKKGTVIEVYAGKNQEDGPAAITLSPSSAVKGITFFYPEQRIPGTIAYPWTIQGSGMHCSVIDCTFVNAYKAIDFGTHWNELHYIRNIFGCPLKVGVSIDKCSDIGRIENVHFNPHYWGRAEVDGIPKWEDLLNYIQANLIAFEFARTDWEYVHNTFVFGAKVGYRFYKGSDGTVNGNFLGIGADSCRRAILVEQCQGPGLLVTNGEFVGRWGSADSVCLEIGKDVRGKVQLTNCSFWGPIDRCVWMRADSGHFIANSCNFLHWDNNSNNNPALDIEAGKVIVQGCSFGEGNLNARVGQAVKSAIFMGNQAPDGFEISNAAGKRMQAIGNEQDPVQWTDKARLHYRINIGADGDKRYVQGFQGQETMPWKGRLRPSRWTRGESELILPVVPGKQYALSLDVSVPEAAFSDDMGLYLNGRRIASFPRDRDAATTINAVIPPQSSNQVKLVLRVKGWVPAEVTESNSDTRTLGARAFSVIMRASGQSGEIFDANIGEWVNGRR